MPTVPRSWSQDGRLPAALLAGNPEFLRPLVGVAPPGGAHLRTYAVDVGRGADGRWWVLGDRTQAPSGAGYALENRLALSRAIPDVYRGLKVERLAPFFKAFQADLSSFNRRDDSPVCLLTPGLDERDLFRARLSRPLSRHAAGRGRRPDRARRRRFHPHGVRPQARRSAAAPARCRFRRSAGAQRRFAARRQRPRPGGARRQSRHCQCAGLRRRRSAGDAGVPSGARSGRGGRRPDHAERRHLVARRGQRSCRDGRKPRQHGDRFGVRRSPAECHRRGHARRGARRDAARARRAGDRRPRHRLRGAGSGDAVDHADVARGQAGTAAVHPAALSRPHRRDLVGDAGRFRAHRRQRRRARRQSATRRPDGRRLGAVRGAGGRDHAAADGGANFDPARRRRAAEPRRRQSVLGRPLCRTRRSDVAAGAGFDQPHDRGRRGRRPR